MTTITIDISEMSENEIRAALRNLQPQSAAFGSPVHHALLHVRAFHPTCSQVLFDDMGRWRFMDAEHDAFVFGDGVGIDLLEIAVNSIEDELPILFQLAN